MGVGKQRHVPVALPPGMTRYPLWALEPVWTDAENLAPTRSRSSDRPARSESLYRLRYPGPSPLKESCKTSTLTTLFNMWTGYLKNT